MLYLARALYVRPGSWPLRLTCPGGRVLSPPWIFWTFDLFVTVFAHHTVQLAWRTTSRCPRARSLCAAARSIIRQLPDWRAPSVIGRLHCRSNTAADVMTRLLPQIDHNFYARGEAGRRGRRRGSDLVSRRGGGRARQPRDAEPPPPAILGPVRVGSLLAQHARPVRWTAYATATIGGAAVAVVARWWWEAEVIERRVAAARSSRGRKPTARGRARRGRLPRPSRRTPPPAPASAWPTDQSIGPSGGGLPCGSRAAAEVVLALRARPAAPPRAQ